MESTEHRRRPRARWLAAATAATTLALLFSLLPFGVVQAVVGPTVTIEQAVGQADPTNASSINFTVVFSEPVTLFVTGDVTLSGTAGATTGTVTGSGATYNVAVSGMTTLGTVIATIAAGVAQGATDPNNASTSSDNTVTYDNVAPIVTNVTSPKANGTYTVPESISVTVTFNETVYVTGTPTLALATGNPASTPVSYSSGSPGLTLTFTYVVAANNFSPDLDYASTTALALNGGTIKDLAGNAATRTLANPGDAGSLGANKAIVIQDTTSPTVAINQAGSQLDPTSVSPVNFTVVFSEPVTGFTTSSDVTLTAGTSGGTKSASITGGPTTYNVAVSGMTSSGTVIASIAANRAVDLAGNDNLVSSSSDNTVTYDTTLTVTVNLASGQPDPTTLSPVNFAVVFGASMTGFDAADVTISGTAAGTKTIVITGSGTTYNVAVSGMTSSGTVIASIAADAVLSTAGTRRNAASTSTDNTVAFVLPSKLAFTSQPGSSTSNVAFSTQPVVAIQDASGTTATNVPATTVTLAIGANPGGGTLTCTSGLTRTTSSGVATFSGCSINNAGVGYTLTAAATGLTSATSSVFNIVAPPAAMTISANPTTVNRLQSTVLTIQFAAYGAFRSVVVQRKTALDSDWVAVGVLTTDSLGRATVGVTPASSTQYRASFLGASDLLAATSAPITVGVRYTGVLTPKTSTGSSSLAKGTRKTYTGTMRPIVAGQRMSFMIYKWNGSAWVFQTSATIAANSNGQATFSWTWSRSGKWYLRIRVNADSMYATAWSNLERVTIP
jgi:hypothetical protein